MLRYVMAIMLLLSGSAVAAPESWTKDSVRCEAEADCLKALVGTAHREGDRLHLKLENGETKTLVGNEKACLGDDAGECVIYDLRAHIPALQAYVVGYRLYEGSGGIIVSTKTGQALLLETLPEFSPDGRWFVSAGPDYAHGESLEPYDVTIWSYAPDASREVFRYLAPRGRSLEYWEFAGWESNDRIRLKVRIVSVSDPELEQDADAVRTDQGWKLNRPN
ncbi:hypothetical protein [Microvirga flavescens]|uniref:hypothetical protein n=1 Tax=Microvirga flavescens TaxID=2249811 RepID=UPI000DD7A617|nr:hypothetical protein [Microvirga flavescens]